MQYFKHTNMLWRSMMLGSLVLVLFGCHQQAPLGRSVKKPFGGVDTAQVEAVLKAMTTEEKIGQLIMLRSQVQDSLAAAQICEDVRSGKAGGVILENMWLEDYLNLKDSLTRVAKLPLFLGTTEKVSLLNQFKGLQHLPPPAAIASIDSAALQETLEHHYLMQCEALGINFSISPTFKLDDEDSPVFDEQLFESDTQQVMMRAYLTMEQLQSNRIVAVGSSFSEKLYVKNDTLRDSLLRHFLFSTREGLAGLLVEDPAFKGDTSATARPESMKKYLNNNLDFYGLMVVSLDGPISLDKKWEQGADLFLTSNARAVFARLQALFSKGKLDEKSLDDRVRQILSAKAWVNGGSLPVELSILPTDSVQQPVHLVSLSPRHAPRLVRWPASRAANYEDRVEDIRCYFEDPNWLYFADFLFEKSVILANNHDELLPAKNLLASKFEVFEYGRQPFREFKRIFLKYADYSAQELHPVTAGDLRPVSPETNSDSLVAIVLLDSINLSLKRNKPFVDSLNSLSHRQKTILLNFGNPKNLQFFDPTLTMIQVFERNKATEAYTAQVLFGGMPVDGKIPLNVSVFMPYGTSVKNQATRLGFSKPEKTGISEERLVGINAIAETAIDKSVFPGCQVVVAKDGQVIFSEAFGNHSYGKKQPVNTTDLYDIASVTKVAATTLAIMRLYEQGKIGLKNEIGDYLSMPKQGKVGNIKIKELLLHTSGLQSQMPIAKFYSWRNVPSRGCNSIFCRRGKPGYNIQVAKGLFLRNDYPDTIFKRVANLQVGNKRYRYSDVNFYLLQKITEKVAQEPMDAYLNEHIYFPLGLRYTTFKPIRHFTTKHLIPTENDLKWRHTLVDGFVHDPAAALLGGVSGNAGLFSNAEDLAALFQIFLNNGEYGGVRYFEPETVEQFTKEYAGSNRSLGFEKPATKRYPSFSKQASPKSFGHTGFTGTCIWVDPTSNLVYIFLSNRIHPSTRNAKIFSEAVRSRIHEVVYDAFGSFHFQLPELNNTAEANSK